MGITLYSMFPCPGRFPHALPLLFSLSDSFHNHGTCSPIPFLMLPNSILLPNSIFHAPQFRSLCPSIPLSMPLYSIAHNPEFHFPLPMPLNSILCLSSIPANPVTKSRVWVPWYCLQRLGGGYGQSEALPRPRRHQRRGPAGVQKGQGAHEATSGQGQEAFRWHVRSHGGGKQES